MSSCNLDEIASLSRGSGGKRDGQKLNNGRPEKRAYFRRASERKIEDNGFFTGSHPPPAARLGRPNIDPLDLSNETAEKRWARGHSKKRENSHGCPTDAIYRPLNEFQGPPGPVTARTSAIEHLSAQRTASRRGAPIRLDELIIVASLAINNYASVSLARTRRATPPRPARRE